MIEEGLLAFRDIVQKGTSPTVLHEDDSAKVLYINGEVRTIDKLRPRRVRIDNLHDLAEFADQNGFEKSAIYVSREKVIFVVSNECRIEWAEMALKKTSAFAAIEAANGKSCDQRTLLKLLKIKLDGCISRDIVEAYRRIDVAATTRKVSEMRQTGDKGMSEFKVEAAEQTPDVIVVSTNVFVDGGPLQTNARIRVGIDIDFSASPITFGVSVLGDELEASYSEALLQIKQFVVDQLATLRKTKEDIPVFFGVPNL